MIIRPSPAPVQEAAAPSEYDVYLFHQGTLMQSYRTMGAHPMTDRGTRGVRFAVWAPHASQVSVVGDFNDWNGSKHVMTRIPDSGIWWIFVPGLKAGVLYKFEIRTPAGERLLRADPYAFRSEVRPATASIVHRLGGFRWTDQAWMKRKAAASSYAAPMNIYEVHLGTWRKHADGTLYTYKELADELIPYVQRMGYTHIELLPLSEHPYDRSWGYQSTGFYAVTSRFGKPNDFKAFVNRCHEQGIGVILDWVPGHYVRDEHGLRQFDGSALYEHADPRKAEKPLWGTLAFDFEKPEVCGFLISNALFWMDEYHIDGLRVDAVASMLEMNFDKPRELWLYNEDGSTENRAAVRFFHRLNETVFRHHPHALMIAEDSSDRPLVSRPVHDGGLGFNYKWNMGWMNDTICFMMLEPEQRGPALHKLLFSFLYMHSENYILPLSHDEVVHGKRSLLNKMPGDIWRKYANLRLLYMFMTAHPGKKLLFMGGEFAQFDEWKDLEQLDWFLLDQYDTHRNMRRFVHRLNQFYVKEPAMWEGDYAPDGVHWIDANNTRQAVVCFMRQPADRSKAVLVVLNFSAAVYADYRVGVPYPGTYEEVLNSDHQQYGGSHQINEQILLAEKAEWHGQPYSIVITVPPLAGTYIKLKEMEPPSCTKKNVLPCCLPEAKAGV